MIQGPRKKQHALFWLGPLITGGCLAIGYETTQRLLIIHDTSQKVTVEHFVNKHPFPGRRIDKLEKKNNANIFMKVSNESDPTSKSKEFYVHGQKKDFKAKERFSNLKQSNNQSHSQNEGSHPKIEERKTSPLTGQFFIPFHNSYLALLKVYVLCLPSAY